MSEASKRQLLLRVLTFGLLIGSWELAGSITPSKLLPRPWEIACAWYGLASSGVLMPAILASVIRVSVGFAFATGVAFGISALMVSSRSALTVLSPAIEILRPISPIAWIPLAILWFRTGDSSACFIVFVGALFPVLLNTVFGLQSVPPRAIDVAKSFRASRVLLFTDVIWPSCKPFILNGMRLGLGAGWMSVIAAELVGVQSGLGYLIQSNRFALRMDNVMAVMLTIGLIGLAMNWLLILYGRYSMPWSFETKGRGLEI